MPYTIKAICPNCKREARGKDQIEELFGWRKMRDGKTLPQSHCRKCRVKHEKKK